MPLLRKVAKNKRGRRISLQQYPPLGTFERLTSDDLTSEDTSTCSRLYNSSEVSFEGSRMRGSGMFSNSPSIVPWICIDPDQYLQDPMREKQASEVSMRVRDGDKGSKGKERG